MAEVPAIAAAADIPEEREEKQNKENRSDLNFGNAEIPESKEFFEESR